MRPTIEELKKIAIECGFTLYSEPFTGVYCPYSEALQAFFLRGIEVGRKEQRESDAKLFECDPSCENLSFIAPAIRNNTGD